MNQRKLSDLLFVGLFMAVLAGVLLITLLRHGGTTSYYENRDLATFPTPAVAAVADGDYFTELETALCDHAPLRTSALKLKTWAELHLFHLPVVNEVVVTEEALLTYLDYEVYDLDAVPDQAETMVQSLATLNEVIESYGGTLLYVTVPNHYVYYQDLYPSWLNNRSAYIETVTEAFFSAMDAYGLNYLDVGALWEEEGNPSAYMSTVDHHYTWAGCYSAYLAVMESLNSLTGLDLTTLTEGDLTVSTLPNPYLGSNARKLCGLWSSGELLSYATLNTEIAFTRYDKGHDYASAASVFSFPTTTAENVLYSFYMGGDISETILQTEREELPDLLVYGDSFTNAMETILYASFDETRSLDLRSYSAMSLLDYVEDYQPDVVICIRDYGNLLSQSGNGNVLGSTE